MKKRGFIKWAFWIAVIAGLYCALYVVTLGKMEANVMKGFSVMCASFTSIPIYFIAGAKRNEFWKFIGSNIVGVLWGMLFLFSIDRMCLLGIPLWLNFFIVVTVIATVECALHFLLPAKLPFNVIPAQFGAISSTFWCSSLTLALFGPGHTALFGVYNFTFIPFVALTLCGGVFCALLCNEGIHFIDERTGKWILPNKKSSYDEKAN